MLRIILITMGVAAVLLVLLCLYSTLVVASDEDDRMEQYYLEHLMTNQPDAVSGKEEAEHEAVG